MTIQEFAEKVEQGEKTALIKVSLSCEANMINTKTHIHQGRKWARVDVGSSGRYMIDPQGNIFGIKAYGVPHMGHYYGTLDQPSQTCFNGRY